jgi:hypothetical protein
VSWHCYAASVPGNLEWREGGPVIQFNSNRGAPDVLVRELDVKASSPRARSSAEKLFVGGQTE